jgi:hypothetical protein
MVASCIALLSSWGDRIWTPPEFRAAAGQLGGRRDHERSGHEGSSHDSGPGTPSMLVTRNGAVVPLRANGGVVLHGNDGDVFALDAETKAALREAEAKTAAHVAEHTARGVDYAFERKRERKLLQHLPDEYMGGGGKSGGGVVQHSGGGDAGSGGAQKGAPSVERARPADGAQPGPHDITTPDGALAAIQAAMRGEEVAMQEAMGSSKEAIAIAELPSPPQAPAAAAAPSLPPVQQQASPPPVSPPAEVAVRRKSVGSTASPKAKASSSAASSPRPSPSSSPLPRSDSFSELQPHLASPELRADVFVAKERAGDLLEACTGTGSNSSSPGDTAAAARGGGGSPPDRVVSLALRCASSLPRAMALSSGAANATSSSCAVDDQGDDEDSSGEEGLRRRAIAVEAAELSDELKAALSAFTARWPGCEACTNINAALATAREAAAVDTPGAKGGRRGGAPSMGAQLAAMVESSREDMAQSEVHSDGADDDDEDTPPAPDAADDADEGAAAAGESQTAGGDSEARSAVSGGRNVGALLVAAAAGGHVHAVKRLLKGATAECLGAKNRRGQTALAAAIEGGHTAVVELLMAASAPE